MAQQLVLPEDEMERKAGAIRLLSLGLITMMGIAEVLTIVIWMFNSAYPIIAMTVVLMGVMFISAVAYWLTKTGRVQGAGYIFVLGLTLESAIITPMFGGFVGPMAITYLFSILVAGIIIDINASYVVATLAVILYLVMIPLEQAGFLPQIIAPATVEPVMLYQAIAIRVIFFYLVAFLSWFAASRLNQALQNVRRYATGLQVANEKLQASEEELRTSNEELEASNEELRATEEELRSSNEELETANEELREAQEQLVRSEKLAAIGQLAGGVGHELRNPLGAIKNAVYYIKGKVTKSELAQQEPRVVEFLEIMDDEINSSNKIISDLLSFSRVGKPAVSPARIEKVIDDALQHTDVTENIELIRQVGTNLPEVEIDTEQIRQVMVNMITNAVQAMPERGKLIIGAKKKGSFLEVKVTDTGSGIPEEARGKIFDPLYTMKAKGIGLGLAVCKSIIDRHEGRIDVESSVGKGTTFTITLPLDTK
ncbi:sensor histidine kinase [Chloroflexota bacterium]